MRLNLVKRKVKADVDQANRSVLPNVKLAKKLANIDNGERGWFEFLHCAVLLAKCLRKWEGVINIHHG